MFFGVLLIRIPLFRVVYQGLVFSKKRLSGLRLEGSCTSRLRASGPLGIGGVGFMGFMLEGFRGWAV